MKQWKIILTLIGMLVMSVALAPPAAGNPTSPAAVRMETTLAHPVVLAGEKRLTYLKVAVTGVDSNPADRAAVNVAIVLDRSGSMSGVKIEQAKRAVIAAIEHLRPEDIVSVVTYASYVTVLIPATKVSDREVLYRRIQEIAAVGGTALFAGVSKGAHELRKFAEDNRVSTIVLLSDGMANVGPSSPGELAELGETLGREGITVTTIGLGLSFNEDLMSQLALKSEGNHFFVEDATNLADAFATEFGDAISATAQDTRIVIECSPEIRPVRMLGREAEIRGQRVEAYLNQLYRDQTKYVLLEVELPAGEAGATIRGADVTVTYRDLGLNAFGSARSSASVRFTSFPAEVAAHVHRETMISAVTLTGVENNKVAVALRDQGRVEEARAMFRSNSRFAMVIAAELESEELKLFSELQQSAADKVDSPEWEAERKLQVEQNTKNTNQRGQSLPLKTKKKPHQD